MIKYLMGGLMKRIFGLDLIRTLAVYMVLSVHFFLNNGFYEINVSGLNMFIQIFLRWTFYTGVPLFIIITGYLKKEKTLNNNYYSGIKKIIFSYLFISIICIFFKRFYLHEHGRILSSIVSIFDFTANGYSWYIEMYLGLFLLIPFLNILYNNLDTKDKKQKFIFTLVLLISIKPIINYLRIDGIKMEIIPDWWDKLYPLLFYFIGCYIRDYKIKINKIIGLLICITIILTESLCSYLYNYNSLFSWDFLGGYGSLQTVILATTVFLILYDIQTDKKMITNIISKISILSLDIYLFSYIVDNIVYSFTSKYLNSPKEYLKYYFPIVLVVFIMSFIFSYIKMIIFNITEILNTKMRKILSK